MKRTWLEQLRKRKGLTHQQVADRIKISRQFYGFIENGERDPSVATAKKLGNLFEFDWTIFFDNKSNKTLHINSA